MNKQQRTVFGLIRPGRGGHLYALHFPQHDRGAGCQYAGHFRGGRICQYPSDPHADDRGPPYLTLRNFLSTCYYFYGYPFYFFSALAILPVKLLLAAAGNRYRGHRYGAAPDDQRLPNAAGGRPVVYIQTGSVRCGVRWAYSCC